MPLFVQFLVRGLKQGSTQMKQTLEIKRNISRDDRKDDRNNIGLCLKEMQQNKI